MLQLGRGATAPGATAGATASSSATSGSRCYSLLKGNSNMARAPSRSGFSMGLKALMSTALTCWIVLTAAAVYVCRKAKASGATRGQLEPNTKPKSAV